MVLCLCGGHAASSRSYSLIDMKYIDRLDDLVLRLRNPWGHTEWTGQLSDLDLAEHADMKELLTTAFSEVTLQGGGIAEAEPFVAPPLLF